MSHPPIRLLHGLLDPNMTMIGLERFLGSIGYTDLQRISYDSYGSELPLTIRDAERAIIDSLEYPKQPVIVIAHSLGGVLTARFRKLNIVHAVLITAPLQGSYLVKRFKPIFGSWIKLIVGHSVSEFDAGFFTLPPPFPYHTVSASIDFRAGDGLVKSREMQLEPDRNIHLSKTNHLIVLFSRELYDLLEQLLATVLPITTKSSSRRYTARPPLRPPSLESPSPHHRPSARSSTSS